LIVIENSKYTVVWCLLFFLRILFNLIFCPEMPIQETKAKLWHPTKAERVIIKLNEIKYNLGCL